MNYLKSIRQDYVVLSDSDTVINAPLEDVLRRHIDTGADITAVCTAVSCVQNNHRRFLFRGSHGADGLPDPHAAKVDCRNTDSTDCQNDARPFSDSFPSAFALHTVSSHKLFGS